MCVINMLCHVKVLVTKVMVQETHMVNSPLPVAYDNSDQCFLAPGTGSVEDKFYTDFRMIHRGSLLHPS